MVKVYSVYMASFDGTASLNATLTDPNGQYVSKADFDLIQSKLDKAVLACMETRNILMNYNSETAPDFVDKLIQAEHIVCNFLNHELAEIGKG